MKKILFVIFFTLLMAQLNALGTLRVESIKELPETYMNLEVRDANGKFAAVLIVQTEMDSTTQANISLEKGTEQTQSNCSVGSTEGMVFVQGGTFQMGSNEYEDEKPIHSVTISDFYIGKYEVTQKEWKEVMGANPSIWKGDNLPVEQVSWYEEGCLY